MLSSGNYVATVERVLPENVKQVLKRSLRKYRLLTSSARVFPDFIIFGARRCGTTSLYTYLTQHPSVLPALRKETFYFDHFFEQGERWYRSHFPTRAEKALLRPWRGSLVTGEATPGYLLDPFVPERIKRLMPDIKLIGVLRNPVDAVYSAYQFGIKRGTYSAEEVVFEERILREQECLSGSVPCQCAPETVKHARHFLSQYIYINQLQPWFDKFPRENILILISEELFGNPRQLFNSVQDFLEIPRHDLREYPVFNDNRYTQMAPALKKQLVDFYSPYNEKLANLIGRKLNWGS